MRLKRYQYYSKDGIVWTDWFEVEEYNTEKYQYAKKLLNEYKTV